MYLTLSEQERDFLLELLDNAHREKLIELRHTHGSDYKRFIERRLVILESIKQKMLLEAVQH